MRRRFYLTLLALLIALPGAAHAQEWPQKTVRIVVPFPAGGSNDTLCRIVADKLSGEWKQPVIVDNKAGAGGNIGAEIAYGAPATATPCCAPRRRRSRSTTISTRRCPTTGRSSCRSRCWR